MSVHLKGVSCYHNRYLNWTSSSLFSRIYGGELSVNIHEHEVGVYLTPLEAFLNLCITAAYRPVRDLGKWKGSQTCSSSRNKIIVIGGEDSCDYYPSDVHILDANTRMVQVEYHGAAVTASRWAYNNCYRQDGKKLFVFGGFSDEQNLYDVVLMLDHENGIWTKVIASGEGLLADFPLAGESLDLQM
ncbi:Galactose oxidase/kelch repeat superfamily protein [Forsythia ovata]|uniref:Galactose oxidase/kelch repeat superfamily protein n=1 Tax=Forsythia ovata TaxID=205694 RepID=A0ABD1PL91_9LAMI